MEFNALTIVSITLNLAMVFFYTFSIIPLGKRLQEISVSLREFQITVAKQSADHEARIRQAESSVKEHAGNIGRVHGRLDNLLAMQKKES